MTIDWIHLTPVSSLLGGALIGLAAALLMLFNGRIAGISGIVSGLLRPTRNEWAWRLAFVLGIVASPWIYQCLAALPESTLDAGWPALVLAGLLVGVGTRYGSGCTSGHGVCGLARLSPRSLAATLAFMASGLVTVYVVRHLLGG
jgi:uncharacterized membrane protein YedE/YeeE